MFDLKDNLKRYLTLKVLSYWNLNKLILLVNLQDHKLKVLSYWNLNFEHYDLTDNVDILKVLSYWNLNTISPPSFS